MSKEAMRAEADRLIKEAMEKKPSPSSRATPGSRPPAASAAGKIASRRRRGSSACRSPARNAGTSRRRCRLYCAAMRLAAAFVAIVARFAALCADCGRLWSFIALTTCTWGLCSWVSLGASIPSPASRPRASAPPGLAPRRFFSGVACPLKACVAEGLAPLFCATARLAGNAAVGVWAGGGGAVAATNSDIRLATRTKCACSLTASATSGQGARAGIRVASASCTNWRDSH